MKVGDLVYHKEDIKDGPGDGVPGLVIKCTTIEASAQLEAIVYFVDRMFSEYHLFEDLIRVTTHEHNKRIQNAIAR
jgi:hypothetical protein